MPRPSTPGSSMSSTVKENKPVWCSPGRPQSTLLRTGKGKPLGELKSGNRGLSLDGTGKAALLPVGNKAPSVQKDSPSALKARTKVVRATPQVPTVRVPSPISTSRPKTTRAPVTDETPPRNRPIKKPLAALVTPTNKLRKPVATTSRTPRGVTNSKVCTPKDGTATKASTPGSSTAREKNQTTEETPVRKVRESPRGGASAAAQGNPKSGCRNNRAQQQQGVSGWAGSAAAARGRKASPTHGRPPVKHLFLSPQVAKKTLSKKDFVRKSIENHGIWAGSAPLQRKQRPPQTEKQRDVVDSEMPPPAQPTHSPEIPKRGSREASGEGIRGFFGAGPMVAPDGVGFLRDRRKCKPRGMLMVGQEGLSMDSDSSGVLEASVQMPPPSVASVEWMTNTNDAKVDLNVNDFSSGSIHEPAVSMSISDFPVPDNQASDSFGKEERRTSTEDFCDGALEQLRLSSSIDDMYSKFAKRSQAFLQHLDKQTSESFGKERTSQEDFCYGSLDRLRVTNSNDDDIYSKFTKRSQAFLQHLEMRQSQLTRAGSFSYVRQSPHYKGDESSRRAEQPGGVVDSDLEYEEDVTINWRQGLPSDSSIEMTGTVSGREEDPAGKNDLVRSSLSFTSSWVPQSEDSRRLSGIGNPKTWYATDSPWYGFSPITPEFHRSSQLSEGRSKEIDALVAGSVRRRIMTDQSSSLSDGKLDASCTSLTQSMQTVNPEDSSRELSAANSSQETSSSFQFARNSYASASAIDMEPMPQDNFMCQTSSPIERSPFSEDFVCQTASPIDQVYGVACSIDCSVDCSIDCSVNASDDDEVEYSSPILGDYFSAVNHSSPSARSGRISPDRSTLCDEINMGARAVRKSSMSRTLEELMRHNLTL